MRSRDEVLREFPNAQLVLTGERTVWRDKLAPEIKRMADRIRELESQLAAMQSERDEWENAAGVYEAGMVRAERERDEARRERDEWRDKWAVSAEFNAVHQNRAERAERVVNMLRVASALPSPDLLTYGDWADLCDAVRAFDAAEGTA